MSETIQATFAEVVVAAAVVAGAAAAVGPREVPARDCDLPVRGPRGASASATEVRRLNLEASRTDVGNSERRCDPVLSVSRTRDCRSLVHNSPARVGCRRNSCTGDGDVGGGAKDDDGEVPSDDGGDDGAVRSSPRCG